MANSLLNNKYRVRERVGGGAEGAVFLAEEGDRRLAVKQVMSATHEARDRLAGEFQRLARLGHPNLVKVHDLETVTHPVDDFPAGSLFFTADFIDGVPADQAIAALPARQRLPALIAIAEDAAAALAHLHAAGLLHCDVKPANLLVGETQATLVDLGLAGAAGNGAARGTPIYMAPEALSGAPDRRSDLYALGATLLHAASGRAPELARAPAPAAQRAAWLPAELAALLDRMLAADPAARPSSALVVLDHLARVREALSLPAREVARSDAGMLLPPRLVGRDAELALLTAALASAALGQVGPRLVRLIGPAGAGRSALVAEALRRHQVAAASGTLPALPCLRGASDRVLAALGVDPAATSPAALAARALDRIARSSQLVAFEGADPVTTAIAYLAPHHAELAASRSLIVAEIDEAAPGDPDAGEGALDLAVAPLDAGGVAELAGSMLGRPVREGWARELARTSGGLPGLAALVVRAAAQQAGAAQADEVAPAELLGRAGEEGVAALVRRRAAALPEELASVLEGAAVLGVRAPVAGVAATLGTGAARVFSAAAELAARGFAELDGDDLVLPGEVHAAAIDEAIPTARRRSLHRAALRWRETQPVEPSARARHLAVTGPAERAARAALDAATEAAARGRGDEALGWAERAAATAPAELASLAHAVWSERAAAVGRYPDAVAAAQRAARARDESVRRRAHLALARAQQMMGELDAAEATLTRLREEQPDDDEAAAVAVRLLITRARYRDAAEVAGDPAATAAPPGPMSPARAMRLEAAGLARLYLGDHPAAETQLAALEAGARAAEDRSRLGRALALRGMAAQMRGDVAAAALLYAQASGEARAAGDAHAAAVCDLNQATAHTERGRHGLALIALDRARRDLRALGDVAELAAALYNRGNALVALGAVSAARRAADEALARAAARGTPEMEAWAHVLDGDVARREGDQARAEAAYRRALAIAAQAGLARARLFARITLAEILAEAGRSGAQEELAAAADDGADSSDEDRDRLRLARARVALASGRAEPGLAEELASAAERGRAAGRLELAWRAEALAARLSGAEGQVERAAELAARARAELDRITADTPEAHRGDLGSDPDAQGLAALEREVRGAPAAASASAIDAPGHLRRLLALSRRLNSELRLEPLLDDVIDTAIELTSAERGFLLLYPPGRRDRLEIVVARNIGEEALAGAEGRPSRSIAERAAKSGEVQLTVDAAFDERFGAAESVAALRLRSVLAVPLRQKGRVIGTIYVDHRYRSGAFDSEAVELACELADIAAVAIENARLVEENRRRQEEIDRFNQRLSDDLGRREAELIEVKARLGDDRAELRHAYSALVGRSPAMVELLRTLDRLTDSTLPVVLFGESGTGKELVARALHEHGPRRDRAFVAVNCGALPEPLLESELFGHVRGAFTGAERDRRGLFEVADGGTLFLDEIADTSLAMQTRLLRVLQEHEVRRVGDEKTRPVDVRIVAASNRDLDVLVARGDFREDLYYRLNVLPIRVPPLRERVQDIPELAEHILARQAGGGAPRTIARAALTRLSAYAWPGNVRELENELARAAALADGAIEVAHLSAQVAAATPPPAAKPPRGRELQLKPQVEALERALVEEALRRTAGNQTAAARLLGLSRFGLQKKLRRYGIASAD